MYKYLILPGSMLLLSCIFWVFADYIAYYGVHGAQPTIAEDQAQSVKCETRYKRLLKVKQIRVPIPIGNNSACQAELEACTQALSNIKLWCDPNCRQQLGECLEALQAAHALKYECQSWKF